MTLVMVIVMLFVAQGVMVMQLKSNVNGNWYKKMMGNGNGNVFGQYQK